MRNLLLASLLAPTLLLSACDQGPSAADQAAAEAAAETQRLAQAAEEARQAELARLRSNIETVLNADAQTSSIADRTARARAMGAIDLTGCPPEFAAAYIDHVYAWERYAKLKAAIADLNSDDSTASTLAASFISTLFDLGATPIRDHIREDQRLTEQVAQADAEIEATFHQVQRIAAQYGAALPQA